MELQKDGYSMGLPLCSILTNIIMAELERCIVEPLKTSDKIKFYVRYVDNTQLLAKEDDIKFIFDKFCSFHKNLKFTIDCFDDNNIHFLNKTVLYYKPTHTGQYTEI